MIVSALELAEANKHQVNAFRKVYPIAEGRQIQRWKTNGYKGERGEHR